MEVEGGKGRGDGIGWAGAGLDVLFAVVCCGHGGRTRYTTICCRECEG